MKTQVYLASLIAVAFTSRVTPDALVALKNTSFPGEHSIGKIKRVCLLCSVASAKLDTAYMHKTRPECVLGDNKRYHMKV